MLTSKKEKASVINKDKKLLSLVQQIGELENDQVHNLFRS